MWADYTGIRVPRSSPSGLSHSSNPTLKMLTGGCGRIISCLHPFLRFFHPRRRKSRAPLYQVILQEAPVTADSQHCRPVYPSGVRRRWVMALAVVARRPIYLASADDLAREIAKMGVLQVSKACFPRGGDYYQMIILNKHVTPEFRDAQVAQGND
jgi:hypothetical protein